MNLDRRERKLVSTEDDLEKSRVELKDLRDSELTHLEQISSLSIEVAKDILLKRAEDDISRELQIKYRDAEKVAKEEHELTYDNDEIYLHDLENHFLSEYPIAKQSKRYMKS